MPPLIDENHQGDGDLCLEKEEEDLSPLTLQQVEALHTQTFLTIRQHLINVQQLARVDRLEEAESQLQHTVDSALQNVSSGELLRRLLSRVAKDNNNKRKIEESAAADSSMIYLDNSKILTNPNTQSALIALRNDANILRQLIRRKIADKDFNNRLRKQEEKEQQNAVVDFELKFSNYNAEKSNFVDNSQQTLIRYKDMALNSLFQLQQQTSRLQSISSKLENFYSALNQLSRLANRIEQLLNCNHLLFRAILCVLILFLLYIVIRKFR